jgi:hypothetical protein
MMQGTVRNFDPVRSHFRESYGTDFADTGGIRVSCCPGESRR